MTKLTISDSKLNFCLNKLFIDNPHPLIEDNNVNFKSAVQISSSPLKIKIFTNYPNNIDKNCLTPTRITAILQSAPLTKP